MKNICWLCGRGHGIDNGDLVPGELKPNLFGDMECLECTRRLAFTVFLMERPDVAGALFEVRKFERMNDEGI